MRFFKIAQKVSNQLGYFGQKFCCQKLSKIVQSGHTTQHLTWSCAQDVVPVDDCGPEASVPDLISGLAKRLLGVVADDGFMLRRHGHDRVVL